MLKQSALNSRHYLFLLKTLACFAGLLLGSFLLTFKASMQNAPRPVAVNNSVIGGNYQPTPEPPSSTVRGRVYYEDTGRAVKRSSIMLITKDSRGREMSGLTDNNGRFEIKNVLAGTYYAFVNAPGVVSPLAYADISKPKNDGIDEAVEGFPAIVVSGIGDLDVEVPARRGGAISGRVMYADGDAAIGVRVEILRKVKDKFVPVISNFSAIFSIMSGGGFQTDDRGFYRFSGLPNGEYIVKVTENASHGDGGSRSYSPFDESMFGASSLLTMFYPDVLTTEKAQIVNIVAGQEMSEINVYIPERDLYAVAGKVIAAADKSAIKNAKIYLKKIGDDTTSIFNDGGRRRTEGSSDERGIWNFKEIPKGTYTLVVQPPDPMYDEAGIYASNTMSSISSNRTMPTAPSKPRLAKKTLEIVIEDKNLAEITVELGYGATVSGTVKTENNQEMPNNVTITVTQEDDAEIKSATSVYNSNYKENPQKPNHDFKIEGAASGKTLLNVSISDDNFYVKSAMYNGTDLLVSPIDLREGEFVRNVQIVISRGVGTLKGTVADADKQPVKRAEFSLVPVDAAKRKNAVFYRNVTTEADGAFEVKAAPGEYAIVFYDKTLAVEKGEERDRQLDQIVKNAVKVTLKSNETEKISLTMPK